MKFVLCFCLILSLPVISCPIELVRLVTVPHHTYQVLPEQVSIPIMRGRLSDHAIVMDTEFIKAALIADTLAPHFRYQVFNSPSIENFSIEDLIYRLNGLNPRESFNYRGSNDLLFLVSEDLTFRQWLLDHQKFTVQELEFFSLINHYRINDHHKMVFVRRFLEELQNNTPEMATSMETFHDALNGQYRVTNDFLRLDSAIHTPFEYIAHSQHHSNQLSLMASNALFDTSVSREDDYYLRVMNQLRSLDSNSSLSLREYHLIADTVFALRRSEDQAIPFLTQNPNIIKVLLKFKFGSRRGAGLFNRIMQVRNNRETSHIIQYFQSTTLNSGSNSLSGIQNNELALMTLPEIEFSTARGRRSRLLPIFLRQGESRSTR